MRRLLWAIGAILLGAAGQDQAPRREFRPFSAILKAKHWTQTGLLAERSIAFQRGSDGSYIFSRDIEHPTTGDLEKRGIFSYRLDVARRLYTMTEPFVQAAVVEPIVEDKDLRRLMSVYGSCEYLHDGTWKEVSRSRLLDFDVIEVVELTEREVLTRWVAPELECFALRQTDVTDGVLRMREEAVSIDTREPSGNWLEPPAGYAVVTPLELERRYQEKFPGKVLYGQAIYNVEDRYQRSVAKAKAKRGQ